MDREILQQCRKSLRQHLTPVAVRLFCNCLHISKSISRPGSMEEYPPKKFDNLFTSSTFSSYILSGPEKVLALAI